MKCRNVRLRLAALLSAIAAIVLASGCGNGRGNGSADDSLRVDSASLFRVPDTLRVGTLYGPTSYFNYRGTEMGYDYDMISRFAADKNAVVDLQLANNLSQAVEMLDSGLIDILAYEVPITSEFRDRVIPCGVENITYQVLVQPKTKKKEDRISDVIQLKGHQVFVEDNSKYLQRLKNLNDEIGGGIDIRTVTKDTLITEDLIEMVSTGEIPLTIVDNDIARINKTYYSDLDITLQVGFPQRSAWAVAPDKQWLADSVNAWARQEAPRKERDMLLKRYYEQSKRLGNSYVINFRSGRMSPFDDLFRKHAREIGWDWRLLAAVGYTESQFNSDLVSWAGARGVMQLMPATARAFGLSAENITDNDANIRAASKVIQSLDKSLSKYVEDPVERQKFILAAYNSGLAHILDAIALAEKYGYDPKKWFGQTEQALLLKANARYYNDPVCRYGYFRGRQTFEYVHSVTECYEKAVKQIRR